MTKETSEEPIGLQVKKQKIAETKLAKIDCSMMDKKTRQILIYLLNQELKTNKSYPTEWVADTNKELEAIKAGLEMCNILRSRRNKNATEESSSKRENTGTSTKT